VSCRSCFGETAIFVPQWLRCDRLSMYGLYPMCIEVGRLSLRNTVKGSGEWKRIARRIVYNVISRKILRNGRQTGRLLTSTRNYMVILELELHAEVWAVINLGDSARPGPLKPDNCQVIIKVVVAYALL
jgi:hypothetical protein